MILCREQIDPVLRRKYEAQYKARLREALLAPGLTAEQQRRIRSELAAVGKPKDYRSETPPRPGAIRL